MILDSLPSVIDVLLLGIERLPAERGLCLDQLKPLVPKNTKRREVQVKTVKSDSVYNTENAKSLCRLN